MMMSNTEKCIYFLIGWTAGTRYSRSYINSAKLLHWNGRFKPWTGVSQYADIWDKYFIPDPQNKYIPVRKSRRKKSHGGAREEEEHFQGAIPQGAIARQLPHSKTKVTQKYHDNVAIPRHVAEHLEKEKIAALNRKIAKDWSKKS